MAERTWVRDSDGAEVWIVAVKGTFSINPNGSTKLAEEQLDVCRTPKFAGEPGKSSLVYESDLLHTKPTTDVILHGHAYAPQGKPAIQVEVTMAIANQVKTLKVSGDRYWKSSLWGVKMTEPEPFMRMPIIYERAFGGVDQQSDNPRKQGWERRNPVGTGFAVQPEHLVGQRAPNIEYADASISSWRQQPQPAGFGPIARNWSPRLELAGTYDERWQEERLPLLPYDFDERFYLCAPQDQQAPSYLRGGDPVELHNLTPGGSLRFNLPRITLGFLTIFDSEKIDHRGTLHSVILEPDVPRLLMVWHTMLPCHHKVLKLRKTIIRQKEQLNSTTRNRA